MKVYVVYENERYGAIAKIFDSRKAAKDFILESSPSAYLDIISEFEVVKGEK